MNKEINFDAIYRHWSLVTDEILKVCTSKHNCGECPLMAEGTYDFNCPITSFNNSLKFLEEKIKKGG